MPTITVKNIPAEIYELVKQSAATNRRSINSEIITFIERSVSGRRVNPKTVLRRARQLRRKTRSHPITAAAFRAAKRAGRS